MGYHVGRSTRATIRLLAAVVCSSLILHGCGDSSQDEILWRFETEKATMQWAACDAGRLYLCADNVYCLDVATGRLLWQFHTFGTSSSGQVLDDGRLFFQCGGLYALDPATGEMLWEFWANDWASLPPAVDAGRVYAPVGDRLHCIDAATGTRLWSIKTGSAQGQPVAIGDRVFLGVGEKIFCFCSSTGEVLWQYDVGGDRVRLARAGAMLLSIGFDGLVRAHRIETGGVQWQFVSNMPYVRFDASPTGRLLISAAQRLYCLDSGNGEQLWSFSSGDCFFLGVHALARHVIVRCMGQVGLCVLLRDGSLVRRMQLPGGGKVLTEGNDAVCIPGGKTRTVNCIAVPGL